MKKKNWLKVVVLGLLISLSMSSCYYGYYGPPRPHYRHGGGYGYGQGGGYGGGHGHGHHHRGYYR